MRLFVALTPPPEAVAALPPLPRALRPVPASQVHLTLAFLGEQRSAQPYLDALDRVVSGPAPVLRLAGAGAFGTAVWLGLTGDLDRLSTLAELVQTAVRGAGAVVDVRDWRPHLTIARTRGRTGVPVSLPGLADYQGPPAAWTEVGLVRSHLGRDGAVHETLAGWSLAVAG